jgi:hypothetical protein
MAELIQPAVTGAAQRILQLEAAVAQLCGANLCCGTGSHALCLKLEGVSALGGQGLASSPFEWAAHILFNASGESEGSPCCFGGHVANHVSFTSDFRVVVRTVTSLGNTQEAAAAARVYVEAWLCSATVKVLPALRITVAALALQWVPCATAERMRRCVLACTCLSFSIDFLHEIPFKGNLSARKTAHCFMDALPMSCGDLLFVNVQEE